MGDPLSAANLLQHTPHVLPHNLNPVFMLSQQSQGGRLSPSPLCFQVPLGQRAGEMRLQVAATFTVLLLLAAQGHTAKPRAGPSDAGIASEPRPTAPWEETYGFWRQQGAAVPLAQWIARTPSPVPQAFSPHDWDAMDLGNRTTTFHACLQRQAVDFGVRALRYRSPRLQDVTKMVRFHKLPANGARHAHT